MIRDSIRLNGKFTLSRMNNGIEIARYSTPNLVTNAGKNLVAQVLLDIEGYDTGLTFAALGSGTTTPAASDTELDTEESRQPVSSRRPPPGAVAAFFTFFPSTDVPSTIEEVGMFGHSTASSTADSGVLFSRALLSVTPMAGEDLTLSYVLTVS